MVRTGYDRGDKGGDARVTDTTKGEREPRRLLAGDHEIFVPVVPIEVLRAEKDEEVSRLRLIKKTNGH